jgi:hypothetical protein
VANEVALPVPSVEQIIGTALRKAGVVGIDESIERPMLNDALGDANDLLAQWAPQRYLVYHLKTYNIVSTGAQTYAVGLGQPFNINPRPDRIESAYLRLLNNTAPNGQFADLPLDIIPSMENYNQIVLKNLGTLAWRIFYDPDWPVGVLYPWPVPQPSMCGIFVTFKETLTRFANLQDKINLPPEYQPALKWCLAEVLQTSYQLPRDPEITKFARRALNAIRLANVAVPTLSYPAGLGGRGRAYDYHSDT